MLNTSPFFFCTRNLLSMKVLSQEARSKLDEKTSEPYLSDLQKQAIYPDHSDAIRETVIRLLILAQRRHPEVRKTILASAAMLSAPSPEFRRLRLQIVEMNCSAIFKPSL